MVEVYVGVRDVRPESRVSDRPRREGPPQIVIEPGEGGFDVLVGGLRVRHCADELEAHHWGKHAFDALSQGLRHPAEIARAMPAICIQATRLNLHR